MEKQRVKQIKFNGPNDEPHYILNQYGPGSITIMVIHPKGAQSRLHYRMNSDIMNQIKPDSIFEINKVQKNMVTDKIRINTEKGWISLQSNEGDDIIKMVSNDLNHTIYTHSLFNFE